MSLWKIAWRSIQQRGLASALTAASMALGVMLVVVVLSIHGVVEQSFRTNATLGYNMIVGAKGGKLQLTLNTVYYLSSPVENIPYDYYLEFFPNDRREAELRSALRTQAGELRLATAQWQALTAGPGDIGGGALLAGLLQSRLLDAANDRQLDAGRDGTFAQFADVVIPVCLGDYYGNFRVVGTTPAMFDQLRFGESGDRPYEFSAGRNFLHYSDEHGYFEAVVGATVAREKEVKIGDEIAPAHGDPEGHSHARKFTVVGILKPTGTPNDRGVFINMEGFYLMEDHAKPLAHDKTDEAAGEHDPAQQPPGTAGEAGGRAAQSPSQWAQTAAAAGVTPLPVEQREVTALLVRAPPLVVPGLQNMINEGSVAQAVLPVQEIFTLFDQIVTPIRSALLGLTAMICVVSGVSILVSIYNSMNDRKHEIAVIRALGAGRKTVMSIILLESIFLSVGGGLIGWVAAHGLNVMASPKVEAQTGVTIGFLDFAPSIKILETFGFDSKIDPLVSPELLLVPGLIVLAIGVGFLPAMAAYRTDVAKSLGA